jgi:uncharacterized protein
MKIKYILLSAMLLTGLVLTACGPSTINVQPQPVQRTITVTGTGKVTLTPDMATISIGVQSQDASALLASNENTARAQAIINAIKGFDVEDKDIQTTDFSIYPQQHYDDSGNMTGITYMVNNTVFVTVRDLTILGDLLDGVVSAGANNINSIQFDVQDKTEALVQARQAAVADARKQADELTAAAGASLGEVQTISYYDTSNPVSVPYARMDGMAAASSVPVESGSMQITTTVTIVYLLD